ncbi:MAG TPA: cyanophycinase [Vicinamibacteria bacterium]
MLEAQPPLLVTAASARRALALAVALLALGASAPAGAPLPQRLVLVGGGDKPPAAIGQLVAWAGGADARVLVVPWASAEPAESAAAFQDDLRPHRPGRVEVAPFAPLDAAKRAQVLEQLRASTGVFFTGGDQARIMDVLADPGLLEAFRERYRAGVAFGGSSAGTAIMAPRMITGNGDFTVIDAATVETRPGLGLLEGTIVDQHFVKRQRENRLFALVLAHPEELGLGIDEDTALLLEDGRRGRVVGRSVVMLVDGASTPGALVLRLAREGQVVDVARRQVLEGEAPPTAAR